MPIWENYEVTAETKVTAKNDKGQIVAQFTTFGSAKGGSHPKVDKVHLHDAINRATQNAAVNADFMGDTAQKVRDRELGNGN